MCVISNLHLQNLDMETLVTFESSSSKSQSPHDTTHAYLHRMNYYKERYRYQPPVSYTNYTERDLWCGAAPQYYKFFNLTKNQGRSANYEDFAIYNLFFRDQRQELSVVEMGAFTGLSESNSRFFELCLGWNTLLVEGMPATFDRLVQNRPHAHRFNFIPTCSVQEQLANKTIRFDNYPMANAGVADGSVHTIYSDKNHTVDVPCGSLTQVLNDIFPRGHVSFFSLDVEGSEPDVLEQLDFSRVFVEIFMVENKNNLCRHDEPCASRDRFRRILQEAGYVGFTGDDLVIKSDVFVHPRSQYLQQQDTIQTLGGSLL